MDLSPDEDNFSGRLLHQAALWDNVELLEELVTSGADVDARDGCRRSALHAAALAERSRCLHALCRAGADLDAASDERTGGKTALHIAAERGHVENVLTLLSYGARLDAADARVHTPRALAERAGHRHAAAALRDRQDALERERLSQHAALRELVSSGDVAALRARLAQLGADAGLVVNLTPGGASTLLYVACEGGGTGAVSALLEAGADGRAHPVTKYGPLYIAAYRGHAHIATLLLHHFPQAVQQETVEKWLPLHAACIGGHAALVTLLLRHPYPAALLHTYTDGRSGCQYQAAFDVNAVDARGQSALYIAATLGNLPVVDALLSHTVPAIPSEASSGEVPSAPSPASSPVTSPARGGISLGIHAIVTKLTGGNRSGAKGESGGGAGAGVVRPVRVDVAAGGDSALAAAARHKHLSVLRRLLDAGADPAAPAAPPAQMGGDSRASRRRSRSACAGRTSPAPHAAADDQEGGWTALAIACHLQHTAIAEELLARGATDPQHRAARAAAAHSQHHLLAKILATKAYPDPEYKVNKAVVNEAVFRRRGGDLTYTALCPSTPVMVNWRDLNIDLHSIRMSWVAACCARVNRAVSGGGGALAALTRLDLPNNQLRELPHEIFSLPSIRSINAAVNKLERLPPAAEPNTVYTAPVLTELYLQDNRLEEIPGALFTLPALSTLDVSNNKLRRLPAALWAAPALRDLNAAFNHLTDLPTGEVQCGSPSSPVKDVLASPDTEPHAARGDSPLAEPAEDPDDDDATPVIANRAGNAVVCGAGRAHAWRGAVEAGAGGGGAGAGGARAGGALAALNLAHNMFASVPPALACRAHHLTRLNMAYNSLRSMSYVTSYPQSLRQLDLSHNQITCWPSLPQVDKVGSLEGDPLACYCGGRAGGRQAGRQAGRAGRPRSGGSVREQLLTAACPARRHLRLDSLRTLILSNNLLTRIQLTTDDDGSAAPPAHDDHNDDDDDWSMGCGVKEKLVFPLVSMLDVSHNLIRAVPPAIHLLTNLAVLNISGNKEITDLPASMGVLTRLWSVSAGGCALGEPLRSLAGGGRYRSADVLGYLRSVLHAATPYTRMKLMLVGQEGIGKTSLLECLRQESAIQHRRKATDHWSMRMGNKSSRRNMSTVGVDIGLWVYEKARSQRGPVTFRTWDFGGQQEYYATHQYFLSRRALYLVVWRATDGRRGLAHALTWLRSIQARAPGAHVIMVATHYDQVASCNLPECESPESLQRVIRARLMGACDADKQGLPRVIDSIEVSCSTRHNMRLLADIIYSAAFSIKQPGSKEPLLEQRVPASYVALEECVTALATQLTDPVLRHYEYKAMVGQYMQQKGLKPFRDDAELQQATAFLHDNGVLLHYEDALLKELVFVRPQWLCDLLAHVITVREINPFAHTGIMRIEDLQHVLKASPALAGSGGGGGGGGGGAGEAGALALALLGKFELALCWDKRELLVPPLLPDTEPEHPQLFIRSRQWGGGTPRRAAPALTLPAEHAAGTDSPTLIQEGCVVVEGRGGVEPLRRVLLLSYVPGGLMARLVVRLLHDPALAGAAGDLYAGEEAAVGAPAPWGWRVWRRGAALVCGPLTLLVVRERPPAVDPLLQPAHADRPVIAHPLSKVRLLSEGGWCTLEAGASAALEVTVPPPLAVLRRADGLPLAGYQSVTLEPRAEVMARVMALACSHIDLLLEDWYPALGTRFVHTSEGRWLITRIVPCPACLRDAEAPRDDHDLEQHSFHEEDVEQDVRDGRPRLSQESRASDLDSGVGADSTASSRLGSVEGVCGGGSAAAAVAAWTVEQLILSACTAAPLACPQHAHVTLRDLAPDLLLLDVEASCRARWEHITRGAVAGRGAFGTVLAASWRPPAAPAPLDVALKALQPVPPPPSADLHAQHAYKAAQCRWEREPAAAACRAYCGVRQELSILSALRHPHVLPLLAVCAAPLALLLARAPMGALDGVIRQYAGCGARVLPRAARALILQVARALEYLHDKKIVYRDLKSENVLVWRMPRPEEAVRAERAPAMDVHVKLGDYGISRLAPPSGTKGFGGTEGFMAPEIMRHNGEQEYNEKVDCFSFGMVVFEVVSGRQPFAGHDAVKEAIVGGARPALSPRDAAYPPCVLDTMRRCWSGSAARRPSAAALVSAAAAPEYAALRDAAAVAPPRAATAVHVQLPDEEGPGWEIWFGGGEPGRLRTILTDKTHFTAQYSVPMASEECEGVHVCALCRVGNTVWAGDSAGRVTVYNASSCAVLRRVCVHGAVGGAPSAVVALQPLPGIQRLALALECGRLFVVSTAAGGTGTEGSWVLTELGAATTLACLAALPADQGWSVWAGGDSLWSYAVSGGGALAAEQLEAPAPLAALTAAGDTVAGYCRDGVVVYGWCGRSGRLAARLDCSKLAPCSESMQSIAIDDTLHHHRCKVVSVCAAGGQLVAGTAWGCLVVADLTTLRPITVFRPYEADLCVLVPLVRNVGTEEEEVLLATFGRDYRPLLPRFAPHQNNSANVYPGYHCLLWTARHWLPD